MKYYPKGWHNYNFLVTPQELKDILRGVHIVEHCRRVPADYIESNFADFVRDYENFYRLLTSGERIDHIILNNLLKGFSNNLSKCVYGAPFQDSNDKLWYKTMDFSEPCVGFNIFALYLDEERKLQTKFSYINFPENIMGVQLQYPKKIYSIEGNKEILCDELENYNDVYQVVVERIKQLCRNLTITIGENVHRTKIKISPTALKDIEGSHFIKEYNCIIK